LAYIFQAAVNAHPQSSYLHPVKKILLPAFLLLGLEIAAQDCSLQVSGVVSDIDTKTPLANATIRIRENDRSVVSNENGFYVFRGLCPGNYTLTVTHVSCLPVETKLKLEANTVRNFVLPHDYNQLGEVIVQGSLDKQPDAVKSELSGKDVRETRGLTLGETLKKVSGVTVLQTGSTIFKPVIHGLHSQRVLMLNNGVRHEGQQWGSEHAPEIDPFIADRFTVLKGAGALRYGADAIGGAILIEPRALPRKPGLHGEANAVLFSNNRMGVVSAMLEQNLSSRPEWSWRTHLTYKRGGNAKTPDYWLHNTGVEEINGSFNIGYRKEKFRADLYASAFSTRLGIFWGSHIGNLTDLENAINSPVPTFNIDAFTYAIERPMQEASHYLVKAGFHQETGNGDRLELMIAHQENFRKEFDRAMISDEPELNLNLGTSTIDLHYEQKSGRQPNGTFGITAQRQENVWNGSRFFIPNYTSLLLGAYAMERYTLRRTNLEAGIRYDYRNIHAYRNQNNVISETRRNFNNVSATLAVNHPIGDHWRWLTNIALAWRPPSVNELYVNGLHHGTANFEIGDPDLQSERALNLSTQLKYEKDSSFSLDLTLYSNRIRGFINLVPSLPPTLTLRGAFPTFRFIQTDARLSGADISLSKDLSQALQLGFKTALLLPWDISNKTWLQQMPAQRVEADLTWYFQTSHPRTSYITLNGLAVSRQTLVPENMNDYLPPPAGYFLMNLEFATLLHIKEKHLNFGISVYNVLNSTYRDYMNRFRYYNDETGRNLVMRVKIPF
jgi:iron complex outermembrane receptor protein